VCFFGEAEFEHLFLILIIKKFKGHKDWQLTVVLNVFTTTTPILQFLKPTAPQNKDKLILQMKFWENAKLVTMYMHLWQTGKIMLMLCFVCLAVCRCSEWYLLYHNYNYQSRIIINLKLFHNSFTTTVCKERPHPLYSLCEQMP